MILCICFRKIYQILYRDLLRNVELCKEDNKAIYMKDTMMVLPIVNLFQKHYIMFLGIQPFAKSNPVNYSVPNESCC